MRFFRQSVETLVEESGLALDHPVAAKFRSHVLAGQWNRVSLLLKDINTELRQL